MNEQPAGIGALLRDNVAFRRLWYGQVVSQAGDWFNQVAVMVLLYDLTGSGAAVGGSLILRMLPLVFLAPFAGVLVDRLDRKRILILSDLLRGAIVPFFLVAAELGSVGLVYALVVLQVSVSAFFDPARTALIPSIVSPGQLLSANALASVTWSVMLGIGSALGGLTIDGLGVPAAFAIDAATYFVSAAFIAGVSVAPRPLPQANTQSRSRGIGRGFGDLVEGFVYLWRERSIRSLVIVKTGVGLAGGMVLLLSVFAERVFPFPDGSAVTLGILMCARGVGTAVGPFLGRAISGYDERAMRRLIPLAFLQAAVFFAAFGAVGSLAIATVVLALAHFGSSVNWVFSTVLLQLKVPDAFRGRVFAAEMALFTVAFCASVFATGFALDELSVSPRVLAAGCGAVLLVPAALFAVARHSQSRPGEPPGS